MPRPQPCKDLQDLLRYQSRWLEVPWGEWRVAAVPLASFEYYPCRAIAFSDGYFVGLSHIYPTDQPQEYVEPMLEEFLHYSAFLSCGRADSQVRAILVGGYGLEELEAYCQQNSILIVDQLSFQTFGELPDGRDIIVRPKAQDLRVYLRAEESRKKWGSYVARSFDIPTQKQNRRFPKKL